MANVYEIVTSKILDKLEQGVIPWRQPWAHQGPVNWESQRPYRGINALLLDPGEYATWNQIKKAGGRVLKGKKGHIVVFWKMLEVDGDTEETSKTVPFLRYYKVWEINTQCEGLESRRKEPRGHDPIEEAEKIVEGYQDCPPITFEPSGAWYVPSLDRINVPQIKTFDKPEEYYSTLFHEMVHSTGHKSRLNRPGFEKVAAFGSETYSFEELVAEIGAAFLCGHSGIEQETLDNSASYISHWKRLLQNDSKVIVKAASQAQKAADYVLGIRPVFDI